MDNSRQKDRMNRGGGEQNRQETITTSAPVVPEGAVLDGRIVIKKRCCPICGGDCSVVRKNGRGYPEIFCKKHKKHFECVWVA